MIGRSSCLLAECLFICYPVTANILVALEVKMEKKIVTFCFLLSMQTGT